VIDGLSNRKEWAPSPLSILSDDDSSGPIVERLFDLSFELRGTSRDGYITQLSASWEQTLGWTRHELMAGAILSFIHPDDLEATGDQMTRLTEGAGVTLVDFVNRFRTKAGGYRWLSWTVISGSEFRYFVAQDVTEAKEIEILHERSVRVMAAIVNSVTDGIYVVDPTGHLMLVNPAAVRMLGYDSPRDLLGQLPHETLHHCHADGSAYPIGECPLAQVRVTRRSIHADEDIFWRKDGSALPVSYSSEPIDLSDGVGCVVTFQDITAVQAERNQIRSQVSELAWFDETHRALREDRLLLYGQPIIDIASGEVVKHELLLRMIYPDGEILGPGLFLPAAEKYGLIHDIDRWVLSQAIEMAANGRAVALNLSASSMGNVEILLHIERELERTSASPGLLTFEVTETAMMKDLQDGRRFADRLVGLGCSFSLDDFGTGYGSLNYLRQLPIAYLKIDVAFVRDMRESKADQGLVQAIVQIAKSVGKITVAEGVEDETTFKLLSEFGVDLAQGFFLGRPGPLL
jgi:PAS domain S-box-containing protein